MADPTVSTSHDIAQLAALAAVIEDALVTTDMDGVITSWNPGAERLYGYSAFEAIGRRITIIFPPDRAHEEQEILARVRRGEVTRDSDAVRRRRDGTDVAVGLTIAPILAGTEPVGTVRLTRDLSERQQADRAVRRLAAIVQSSDDAIISKDLNGIVTSWNRSAERLFGYTADEMIGRSIRQVIPADRQNEEDIVLGAIRRGDKVDHFETIREHKDGSPVPISLTVSPIFDASGRVVGASKIARDNSEARRLEADRAHALALAEENAAVTERINHVGSVVASALDRLTILQAVVDAATELTGAGFGAFCENAIEEGGQACRLTTVSGPSSSEIQAFPIARDTDVFEAAYWGERVVRIADVTAVPGLVARAHAGGAPPVRSYMAVPVKGRSSESLGSLLFTHAEVGRFTERHERIARGIAVWASVALENARLYVGVQEASRLKDQFIATLSHELRTPLNAILGYARMLRSGIVAAERQQRAVATIERNATSLAQIVEDVLDVSRIISGKMRLNVQNIDLADVVRSAVAGVHPAAEAKGIRVEESFAPDTSPISGDPERLQQIVWNLTSNAVKFTPAGGRVNVRVGRAGSQVEIAISDTGIGITRAFLPHVFEAFRQADASLTRERGGLGLGLNITRQLVEMHGGTIEAESAGEGKGATFRVRLPPARTLAANRPLAGHSDAGAAALPNLDGLRILAVDDDGDALTMVQEILQAAGADVSVAASARQALDVMTSLHPDVLVADISMPQMDGFELIGRIRRSEDGLVRGVPAAAMTAYARSEDRVRALRSGYQVHLAKPIDPAELMATVASLAGRGNQKG